MKNYDKDNLLTLLKKIALDNLFCDNVQIDLGRGSEKLDGFMAEIVTVDITDEDTQKSMNLIVKISLKGAEIRSYTAVEQCYKNEIQAYQEFFPALQELWHQFKISKPMKSLVKFYPVPESHDEEYIVMENIKTQGFQMLPVRQLLNDEQTKMIFESYGELHAHSLALRALNSRKFEEITSNNVSVFRLFLDMKVFQDVKESVESIRDTMKEKGFSHILLDKYSDDTLEIMKKHMDFQKENYVSFLHGDGWSNNIMFKYEGTNGKQSLSAIKLIDWQAWTIGPPVIDIMFCLFSSCSKEVFDNFEIHIQNYYKSLSNTLALYNLNADEIYPLEEMHNQLKKHFHFPAMFGISIRKIRSFDKNHNIDPATDSNWLEAVRKIKFDKDYLFESLTYVFDYLDEKTNKNYEF